MLSLLLFVLPLRFLTSQVPFLLLCLKSWREEIPFLSSPTALYLSPLDKQGRENGTAV